MIVPESTYGRRDPERASGRRQDRPAATLGIGALLGLYSVRLVALALPVVMKAPREKNAAFTLLVSIAGIIIALLVSALSRVFV